MSNTVCSHSRNHHKNFRDLSIFSCKYPIFIRISTLLFYDVAILRFQNWKSWLLDHSCSCWLRRMMCISLFIQIFMGKFSISRKFLEAWKILTLFESSMGRTALYWVSWGCVGATGNFEKLEGSLYSLDRTWAVRVLRMGAYHLS